MLNRFQPASLFQIAADYIVANANNFAWDGKELPSPERKEIRRTNLVRCANAMADAKSYLQFELAFSEARLFDARLQNSLLNQIAQASVMAD